MTDWIYRYFLFGEPSLREQLGLAAVGITGCEADRSLLSVELSRTGASPAALLGCTFVATEAMRRQMAAVLETPPFGGVRFYRVDAETSILQATNSPTANSPVVMIGQSWSWERSLDDLGVRRMDAPPGEPGGPR